MFTKNGKHFADWTGTDGKRKRKSFTSMQAAKAHEQVMKDLARNSEIRHVSHKGNTMIQVKEAIKIAENYLQEILPGFSSGNMMLEEVECSEPFQSWLITFSSGTNGVSAWEPTSLASMLGIRRFMKIVQVRAADGELIAIKNKAA